ncbi:MAG: TatD family hydrolase [Desulfobacterales bacterium]|nr:TatD family hydrolase [Desulfobacterales bacterium]
MKLFDSHCHLDDPAYKDDLEAVIQRAGQAGVRAAMIVGVDVESSLQALAIAGPRAGLFASVGVHPHVAAHCRQAELDRLRDLAGDPKVRAWGEIGLDFNRMYSPGQDQESWFLRQLEQAGALNLPVILHERDSGGRLLELLKLHQNPGQKGVVHCFSGNEKELEQYLHLGYHIGITGVLTQPDRGGPLRKLVPLIPAERLLIETDAPYLTPAPERNRTRRNEPAFVRSVLLKLSEVRKEDPEELSGIIWDNTCRLYRVDGNDDNWEQN